MTANTLSRLPLLAGSAVAASLGRAGLWTLSRYMRAPLASTGLLALVTMTAFAASNALYFQTARHPAPLFAPVPDVPVTVAEPAETAAAAPVPQQQVSALPSVSQYTTGSVAALPQVAPAAAPAAVAAPVPDAPVGNRDAFAVQKKLTELGLFSGTVDGFYGPMTASAIRSFEVRNGMTPTGALTPDIVDAILRSDAAGRVPVAQQPAPTVQAPAPVQAASVAPQPQADVVVGRAAPLSPVDQAVDTVGSAAATTIDSIVAAVEGGRSTPPKPSANAPVPQRPVLASASPAAPANPPVLQVASLEPMGLPALQAAAPAEPQAPAAASNVMPANNVQLVSSIQRGLASLGFYHGPIDGHPGDATAKAIREFENFHSYKVTGQINPDLVDLLRQAGASV
ncbi:MAG TPA: peptidoglycan-binding protein [Devosia sp.]|uniref:peptidoglycan-binding protein n=1 Tax=Devosia sp. TaxID=1871048 RepID=UPI002F95BDB0